MADLKPEAIALFKQKAFERGRLTIEEANVSNDILMDNLHLVDEEWVR
jgi:ATP-dependent DNA helicase RecG